MTRGRLLFSVGFLFLITPGWPAAQAPRTIWNGVYTTAQAQRGDTVYFRDCARCHGQYFDGGDEVVALTGGHFMSDWDGETLADFVERIRITMSPQEFVRLSRTDAADVVAYLLQANGAPAGNAELSADPGRQKEIIFREMKP